MHWGLISSSLLLLIGIVVLTIQIRTLLVTPMPLASGADNIIVINQSTTARSLIKQLHEKQLIQSPRLMLLLMKLQGTTTSLKAGIYEIYPSDSAVQFLYRVIDGDVLKETFVIIEGTTLSTVNANLKTAPYLKTTDNDWDAIAKAPEGLVLADTYQYDAGSTGVKLLLRANKALNQVLEDVWSKRAEGIPYRTSYELLIAASIIEKEANTPEEKKLVSSVIVNRLKKRMPLQMDPTVIYGLKDTYKGHLSKHDLKVDSPYNTYLHYGLPPTPIAMVGVDALLAAAHPTPSNYLYYVAKGDGTHVFSANYKQQINAIHQYQKGSR